MISWSAVPEGEYVRHPAYAAVHARFPGVKLDGGGMTPTQGRVVFHQERLFRSTGAGLRAHQHYARACRAAGLPRLIGQYDRAQCAQALCIMERVARAWFLFRDCRTDWEGMI